MKLIEYKRIHGPKGILEYVGEVNMDTVRLNHTYHGKMVNIHQINGGVAIPLIKKSDIHDFLNGKNEISVSFVLIKSLYPKNSYSSSHVIIEYADGLVIDEIKDILTSYPNDEYVIMTPSNYGQFLTYTDFTEGKDYVKTNVEKEDVMVATLTFIHPKMKEEFEWELTDEDELLSIAETLEEIESLTRSEDVLFVHHENGVGYAARKLGTLKDLSGYVYQNYLIEE